MDTGGRRFSSSRVPDRVLSPQHRLEARNFTLQTGRQGDPDDYHHRYGTIIAMVAPNELFALVSP